MSVSRKQALKEQQMQDEINRLEEEKKFLAADIQKIESAMDPSKAAAELIAFVQKDQDPFNSPENDWAKPEGGGCCIIQ